MVEPPVVPAVSATDTWAIPPVTELMVGAPGRPYGVTLVAPDCAPLPAMFTARMRTLYVVPFVRAEMVNGLATAPVESHVTPLSSVYS